MGFDIFSWVVVPLLIFSARIIDVSLGTLRILFLNRGYRRIAPVIGFFEVLVWLLAVREVVFNLRNVPCIIAYCAGFGMGNYVGLWIEDRLSIGKVLLRVVFKNEFSEFREFMREKDFGFTMVNGEGTKGRVKILFSIINRKDLAEILSFLKKKNPLTFYTVENVKSVSEGIFRPNVNSSFSVLFRKYRKAK